MRADCDILFALTGDVRKNSRAVRQLRALVDEGYSVVALTFGAEASASAALPGVRLHVLNVPGTRGPRFFLSVHERVRAAASSYRAAIYHASDLFVLPAMSRAARAGGAQVTYDARELYTNLWSARGKPWTSAFWYAVERRFIGGASAVLTVNESIAERLARMYPISTPHVFPNVPRLHSAGPANKLRAMAGLASDVPLVLYQGYLRDGRGCDVLVKAARRVRSCAVVFLGEGPLRPVLERYVSRHALESRVRFLDLVPPDDLLPLTADADVGACLIQDQPAARLLPRRRLQRFSLPNKLFEYLVAGVPVLGSTLPEISRLITRYQVGCVASPRDVDAVARAMHEMLSNEAARARWKTNIPSVMADYDPDRIDREFRDLFRTLHGRSPGL